jgi:putative oxidoreductase
VDAAQPAALGGIFLYTGYIKLESPLQFAAVLTGYQLFPDLLIVPLTFHFPWVEIALGAFLLIGWKMRYVALAACALLASFTAVLGIPYIRGIDANCGCFSFDDRITIRGKSS